MSETTQKIIERWNAGFCVDSISNLVNFNTSVVRKALTENGKLLTREWKSTMSDFSGLEGKYSDEEWEQVVQKNIFKKEIRVAEANKIETEEEKTMIRDKRLKTSDKVLKHEIELWNEGKTTQFIHGVTKRPLHSIHNHLERNSHLLARPLKYNNGSNSALMEDIKKVGEQTMKEFAKNWNKLPSEEASKKQKESQNSDEIKPEEIEVKEEIITNSETTQKFGQNVELGIEAISKFTGKTKIQIVGEILENYFKN
jgi:hypothetical protein